MVALAFGLLRMGGGHVSDSTLRSALPRWPRLDHHCGCNDLLARLSALRGRPRRCRLLASGYVWQSGSYTSATRLVVEHALFALLCVGWRRCCCIAGNPLSAGSRDEPFGQFGCADQGNGGCRSIWPNLRIRDTFSRRANSKYGPWERWATAGKITCPDEPSFGVKT